MIPEWNSFINADCMDYLKEFPDNYFSLAIVDPPYGAGFTEGGGCKGWFSKYHQNSETPEILGGGTAQFYNRFGNEGSRFQKYKDALYKRDAEVSEELQKDIGGRKQKKIISWDVAPGKEYFKELFRISRNQIIWGGNYFELPPTRCFIVWKKKTINENFSMAMCEYAWTSFNSNAKVFECAPQGKPDDPRFHPTSKPIALYEWVLSRYAQDGDTILDTHVGSASSLIACHRTNHKYIGFEIDEMYYRKSKERIERETAQMNIFDLENQMDVFDLLDE